MGAVKEFAHRVVQDHAKANDELMNWAKSENVQLPRKLDNTHKSMQAGQEEANCSHFGLAYMRGQVEDHQKAVQLLEWEIDLGENAGLQRLASRVPPIVLTHLEMAQTGQGPSEQRYRAHRKRIAGARHQIIRTDRSPVLSRPVFRVVRLSVRNTGVFFWALPSHERWRRCLAIILAPLCAVWSHPLGRSVVATGTGGIDSSRPGQTNYNQANS